jgi:hypothetical protein
MNSFGCGPPVTLAKSAAVRASARRVAGIIIATAMIAPSLAVRHAAIAGSDTASSVLPQSAGNPAQLLTAKERLGEKWTDEQRVDNCNVPLDKRGPKPRPDDCSNPLSRSSSRKP